MMSLAPILVFCYNRPDHLKQTLQAIAKNDLAIESIMYVYCDGAREWGGIMAPQNANGNYITKRYGAMYCSEEEYNAYLASIVETRRVAHSIEGFQELHVIERDKNIGLAANTSENVWTPLRACSRTRKQHWFGSEYYRCCNSSCEPIW